jgi:hypothetical protein
MRWNQQFFITEIPRMKITKQLKSYGNRSIKLTVITSSHILINFYMKSACTWLLCIVWYWTFKIETQSVQ